MAVQYVTSDSQITGVGTFVRTAAATRSVQGNSPIVVGLVADVAWGTDETAWEATSTTDLLERHFPFGPGDSTTWYEISDLPWGRLKVFGVIGTSPTKATITLDDASAGDSLIITAKKFGDAGNRLRIDVIENADTSTTRDVRVYALAPDGTTIMHDVTYVAVQVASGAVTDPGDPYVTMAADGSVSAQADAATAQALASGDRGTIAASDYNDGISAFSGPNSDVDVIVVCGVGASILSAVNEAMQVAGDADGSKTYVLASGSGKSAATAQTDVADWRSKNVRLPWPQLAKTSTYSRAGYSASTAGTISGSALFACGHQYIDPDQPLMRGNMPASVNRAYTGIEAAYVGTSLTAYATTRNLGIVCWTMDSNQRVVPYDDVTSLLVSGVPVAGELERYKAFLQDRISTYVDGALGSSLDLDWATLTLGPNTTLVDAAIRQFLQGEVNAGHLTAGLNADGTTSPAFSLDWFGSSTPTNTAGGRADIAIAGRKTPALRQAVVWTAFDFLLDIYAS